MSAKTTQKPRENHVKPTQKCGNAAAMRKALDEIIETIDLWRSDGTMKYWQYSPLFDIADAALSAPPRNCDVGTPEEQIERHNSYCLSGVHCTYTCRRCYAQWAQMPYDNKPTATNEKQESAK